MPFASLPFSIGFKPTFLDLALGALFFVWLFKLVIGQQDEFIASPIGLLVALFMLLAVFSFALGLTHSPANTFLLRRFMEILIGVALFFVTVNTVRSEEEAVWVTRWVMLGGYGRGGDRGPLLCAAARTHRRHPRPAGALRLSRWRRRAALYRGRPQRHHARHRHGGGPQRAGRHDDPGGGAAGAATGRPAPALSGVADVPHAGNGRAGALPDLQPLGAAGAGVGRGAAGRAQVSPADSAGDRRRAAAPAAAHHARVHGAPVGGVRGPGSGDADAFWRIQGCADPDRTAIRSLASASPARRTWTSTWA